LPHLHIGLSSHGFGHTAQVAPVLAAVRRRVPGLRVSVATRLPAPALAAFLGPDVERIEADVDVGLVMDGPMDVLAEASAAAYAAFHADWPARVEAMARHLRALGVDAVLADVPALPLAAAARAGIPAAALCSLNWADIYRHYCGGRPEAARIEAELRAAYAGAPFLMPVPSMPMPDLPDRREIGPIARIGRDRRAEIDRTLGFRDGAKLALVSTGGMAAAMDLASWPRLSGWHLVVQGAAPPGHPGMTALGALPFPVIDLIRSVDAVVTKTGYGFFAEAACNGTPVVFMRRERWPEEPHLSDWLRANAAAVEIDRGCLERGDLGGALEAALAAPCPPVPKPGGVEEAATFVTRLLAGA